MTSEIVSQDQIRTWRQDGVLCLPGAFSSDWIDSLREGFAVSMAQPGPFSKDYAADRGKFFTDHGMFRRHEVFRRFVFSSPAAAICAALMGARKVNLMDDHMLVKEPGTDTPTLWHQDYTYHQIEGEQFCSLWLALDPTTAENGALRFVKGSHLWGKLYRPIRIGEGAELAGAEEEDDTIPDIEADPDAYHILSWDLEPGDCVVFHGKILHGATANISAAMRRRALAVRFAGDDIRWRTRSYVSRSKVTAGLRDGDVVDSEDFPVAWRA